MGEKAFTGIKIVEYCHMVAGPYCAKLLGDLGAEVLKIEPPGSGDEARRRGPYPGDIPHPERSGLFLYLNTNKRGLTLNVKTATGKDIFKRLVAGADILVEDRPSGEMDEEGIGFSALRELNTRLVMVSITPFGQTGPHRRWKAYHLNLIHGGGGGFLTPGNSQGLDREPLKGGGLLDEFTSGLSAAVATLGALYWQGLTGQGQHLDVSKQQAVMDLDRVIVGTFANAGRSPDRTDRPAGSRFFSCQDGHVIISPVLDHMWRGLVELIGRPQWALDSKFDTLVGRDDHIKELGEGVGEWTAQHTKEEIYHGGQAQGCPIAIIKSAQDIAEWGQYRARHFFVDLEHPEAGKQEYPSSPYRFSETPWAVERPAPLLGQHNEEVYTSLGYSREELVRLAEAGVI